METHHHNCAQQNPREKLGNSTRIYGPIYKGSGKSWWNLRQFKMLDIQEGLRSYYMFPENLGPERACSLNYMLDKA